MIPALLVIAGAAALLAYVLAPFRSRDRRAIPEVDNAREEAEADKRVALSSLVELEQDREAGKLTDADYESLKADYEVEAVTALRRLDRAEGSAARADSDDDLESEIAKIKSQLKCPLCGAPRGTGARCAQCGA